MFSSKIASKLHVFVLYVFAFCGLHCEDDVVVSPVIEDTQALAAVETDSSIVPASEVTGKRGLCLRQLEEIEVTKWDEELSAYYNVLPEIVVSAKVVPVIYLSTPARTTDSRAKKIFSEISKAKSSRMGIRGMVKRYKNQKALLREVFLRQSYLFASDASIAAAMVKELRLVSLFDERRIYLLRNGRTNILELRDEKYVGSDGQPAKLLFGDRVSNDRLDLINPLHIDAGEVRRQTGAVGTRLVATGESSAWLELVLPGGAKIPAMAAIVEGKTEIVCVADDLETVETLKSKTFRFWWNHKRVVDTALLMLAERTLFDEPKDEEEGVQEDGDLRIEWNKAYYRGAKTFFLREVEYKVYDFKGNPTPPQVCVDFIFDVIERASGTWYKKRNKRPGRTNGGINFYSIKGMNRRNIISILQYALDETVPFTRYDIPRSNWVPLRKRKQFAKKLASQETFIQEGDMLIIHGLREQDMKEHFHAVLVLETDPLTGIPMVVADNQGRPRIGSLYQAMMAAPLRSVKHVVRVDLEKMETYSRTAVLRAAQESK